MEKPNLLNIGRKVEEKRWFGGNALHTTGGPSFALMWHDRGWTIAITDPALWQEEAHGQPVG